MGWNCLKKKECVTTTAWGGDHMQRLCPLPSFKNNLDVFGGKKIKSTEKIIKNNSHSFILRPFHPF